MTRLFVGNLGPATDQTALRVHLESFGLKIHALRVIYDRDTGLCKGFAFVEVGHTFMEAAHLLTGVTYDDRMLRVEQARHQDRVDNAQRRKTG